MAVADYALVSFVEAREFLGVDAAGERERIERTVNAASEYVEKQTGRILSREFSGVILDGNGRRDLPLWQEPVTSVASVDFLIGDAPVAWDPVDLTLYPVFPVTPARRRIAFRNLVFPRGFQNVRLTYTAGYGDAGGLEPFPDLLKELALEIVKVLFNERDDDRVATVTTQGGPTGSQVIAYLNEHLPKTTIDLIQTFRVRRF